MSLDGELILCLVQVFAEVRFKQASTLARFALCERRDGWFEDRLAAWTAVVFVTVLRTFLAR